MPEASKNPTIKPDLVIMNFFDLKIHGAIFERRVDNGTRKTTHEL